MTQLLTKASQIRIGSKVGFLPKPNSCVWAEIALSTKSFTLYTGDIYSEGKVTYRFSDPHRPKLWINPRDLFNIELSDILSE